MSANVQVALLGRNDLVREGLRHILSERQFNVVSSSEEPSKVSEALTRRGEVLCDEDDTPLIVLIDQSSDAYSSEDIAGVCQWGNSKVRTVFLAEKLDLDNMIESFRLGAHGYIIKNVGCECLLGSLHLVALGEKVLPSELVEKLGNLSTASAPFMASSDDKPLDETLSARETEILRCLIIGLPNKLIARRLDLSEATVKVHVKGILRKLGVRNRTQAAIYALNHGMGDSFRTGGSQADGSAGTDSSDESDEDSDVAMMEKAEPISA